VTVGVVALLEAHAALEHPAIRDMCLGLDPGAPRPRFVAADFGVPRPRIARDWQRYLGAPTQAGVQPRPEPFEKRQLRPIPDRIAGGVRAEGKIKPHDGAPSTDFLDGQSIELSALESPQLAVGSAGRGRCVTEAQARTFSRQPMVGGEPVQSFACPSATTVGRPLSSTHGQGVSQEPLDCRSPSIDTLGHCRVSRHAVQRAAERPSRAARKELLRRLSRLAVQRAAERLDGMAKRGLHRRLSRQPAQMRQTTDAGSPRM
jgi:hypothetical protein